MPNLTNAASSQNSGTGATIFVSAGTSAAGLQSIINGAAEGSRIVLQEGNYRFTQTVTINRDGITLEGQGNVVVTADDSLRGQPAIQIGSPLFREQTGAPIRLAADATEGNRALHLAAGHGVQVGDVVWIERPNDAALFREIGDTQWQEDKPLRTGLAVVTEVNGGTILLDRGVPFDFTRGTTTVEVASTVQDVTLRNITFVGDYGTANPGNFGNTIRAEDNGMMILVNSTVGTQIENIDIVQPGSNGLVIARSLDAVVDDVSVTGAHNKGDAGNGYGFWLRDIYGCTFTDLVALDTRHAVLFASYTSAFDNTVEVTRTNRDINFHGGLDHGNTVTVIESIRTAVEQGYMAAVSFVNPGTGYGAPTDPGANTIQFGNVVGTVRADLVVGWDRGATISTMGGIDTIQGGAGNDWIDAGTGNDRILASTGSDTVAGGAGVDTLVLGLAQRDALVVTTGGQTMIYSRLGTIEATGVETLQFTGGSVTLSNTAPTLLRGTAQADMAHIAATMIADAMVDNVTLTGTAGIGFVGNDGINHVTGNDGDNIIFGLGGNDRIWGGAGADVLNGGTGNDSLSGGAGADTLNGGGGNDTLRGGGGADIFVGSTGANIVRDFSISQGDMLQFNGFAADDLALALQHFARDQSMADDAFIIENGPRGLSITAESGHNLILHGVSANDLSDYLFQ